MREVRHKDLDNVLCAVPLEGRLLYVKPPNGLPGTTEDIIWVIKKTVYALKDSNVSHIGGVTDPPTTC
jgi:hypothetical protein